MTETKYDEKFRRLIDEHLSSFIDGGLIDQEFYNSVIDGFEDAILNAYRNKEFRTSIYNSENREALKKLLGIAKKLDSLELDLGVLSLIRSGVLPRNWPDIELSEDDVRLISLFMDLLREPNKEQRLEPVINATIDQLKVGKSNVVANLIVEECCAAWQILSNKPVPKYISEYEHPLLQFIQGVFDYVLGPEVASARTYFR